MAKDTEISADFHLESIGDSFKAYVLSQCPQESSIDSTQFFAATRSANGDFKRAYYEPAPCHTATIFIERAYIAFKMRSGANGSNEMRTEIKTPNACLSISSREFIATICTNYVEISCGYDENGALCTKTWPGVVSLRDNSNYPFGKPQRKIEDDNELSFTIASGQRIIIPKSININSAIRSLLPQEIVKNPVSAPTKLDTFWRSRDIPTMLGFVLPQ